jgi:hypothetical protein
MVSAVRIPRAASGTRILLCLLLLAVSLRAMIPVGYMPDTHALRQGVIRIAICTSTGMVSTVQAVLGHQVDAAHDGHGASVADAHGDASPPGHQAYAQGENGGHDPEHAAGAECPFWVAAHLAVDLPPPAIAPILVSIRDEAIRFLAPIAPPPLPPAGPPLGPRAPPSA